MTTAGTSDRFTDNVEAERAVAPAPQRVVARDLMKTFRSRGDVVVALSEVSVTVAPSEMVVLLGPSGCGKTTLLRSIAGLEDPDSGEIMINDRLVYSSNAGIDLPPERRGVSFVFQSYALWPHMTVMDNVVYPLRASGVRRKEARKMGEETLHLVGCSGLGGRYPSELSGGQQQRVALARAIIARRGIIFFDEPLSNIDAKVREKLRLELLNIRDAVGFAGLYVTHDQDEAMILGDKIAVMNEGRILQLGSPREIYERPQTRWVADFIGMANLIDGTVVGTSSEVVRLRTRLGEVIAAPGGMGPKAGQEACAFFRPEWSRITSTRPDGSNQWPCSVVHTIYIGDRTEVIVDAGGQRIVAVSDSPREPGEQVYLQVPHDRMGVLLA